MQAKINNVLVTSFILLLLNGCVVVTTAVGVTTTVVGGAIEIVDIVTPDIFDDDKPEDKNNENEDE